MEILLILIALILCGIGVILTLALKSIKFMEMFIFNEWLEFIGKDICNDCKHE